VIAYSEVLYHENRKRGVRMTCVCPPAVATPMFDKMKGGAKSTNYSPVLQPQEVLDAIEPLAREGRAVVLPALGHADHLGRRLAPWAAWMFNSPRRGHALTRGHPFAAVGFAIAAKHPPVAGRARRRSTAP